MPPPPPPPRHRRTTSPKSQGSPSDRASGAVLETGSAAESGRWLRTRLLQVCLWNILEGSSCTSCCWAAGSLPPRPTSTCLAGRPGHSRCTRHSTHKSHSQRRKSNSSHRRERKPRSRTAPTAVPCASTKYLTVENVIATAPPAHTPEREVYLHEPRHKAHRVRPGPATSSGMAMGTFARCALVLLFLAHVVPCHSRTRSQNLLAAASKMNRTRPVQAWPSTCER